MREIVSPTDEHQRTGHLRRLHDALVENPALPVDEAVRAFLRDYVTKDFKQAALVGLILLALRDGDDLSSHARMFNALYLDHEPALKEAVIRAMPAMSPGDLYDRIADLTVYGDPKSTAHHYAYSVLSSVDADTLKKDFRDYQH
jgi:hypothetical protein